MPTLTLVGGLAFWLTIRAEHNAEERTVRAVTVAAGSSLAGIDGVVLVYRRADGVRNASPGALAALQRLDVTGLRPGWSDARINARDDEVYVIDRADAAARSACSTSVFATSPRGGSQRRYSWVASSAASIPLIAIGCWTASRVASMRARSVGGSGLVWRSYARLSRPTAAA